MSSYEEALQKERERKMAEQIGNLEMFAQRGQAAQRAVNEILSPPPRARTTDPDTSHMAAAEAEAGQAAQQALILDALTVEGEMTADRLDEYLGWRTSTASRRLHELRRMGKVEWLERTAPTRTGRLAHLYRVTP